MAATLFTATVSTARLITLKSQEPGSTVVSQFGPTAISVWRMPAALAPTDWSISAVGEDSGDVLNVVYVRRGNSALLEKEWVVEYRTGDTTMERLATGQIVELSDFGSLDAALSAALLLVVELPR